MKPTIPFCLVLLALVAGCAAPAQLAPEAQTLTAAPTGPVIITRLPQQPQQPAKTIVLTLPAEAPQPSTAGEFQIRKDDAGIEQIYIPAGSFRMGTTADEAAAVLAANPPAFVRGELPSESPAHTVKISRGFWIDRYEVSNGAFRAFVEEGYRKKEFWSEEGWKWLSGQQGKAPGCTSQNAKDAPDLPCVRVTWYEAEAYAAWREGRLPTEAEWEYAARGPDSNIYPWGSTWDPAKANVMEKTGLQPVTSHPEGASWAGVFNMAGNAMEWVQDWLDPAYYAQNVTVDPAGPASGTVKIEKGGWWGSNPFVARSAYRHFEDPPTYSDGHIGFRIVSP